MSDNRKASAPLVGDSNSSLSRLIALLVIHLFLAVVVCIAFHGALDGEFLNWDDDRNFLENVFYRGFGGQQFAWAWQTYHLGVWQPVAWLLFGLEYQIGGMEPRVYHAFSVGFHIINTLIFFWVTVSLLRASDKPVSSVPAAHSAGNSQRKFGRNIVNKESSFQLYFCSAVAAMLFSIHPLRVETVAWISCQPYLPAAMFCMLGVIFYVRAFQSGISRQQSWKWLLATLVCYLLAVGSKAVAVTLPVVLLIIDIYPLRRFERNTLSKILRILVEKLPFFVVAFFVARWAAAAKEYTETLMPLQSFDANARLAQTMYSFVFYVLKTLWPAGLSAFYRLPVGIGLAHWPYWLATAGVVILTIGLIWQRRRWPAVLAVWVAYIVILLPNSGLVQISQQIAADRYGYFVLMPLFVLLAGGLMQVSSRLAVARKIVFAGIVAVSIPLIFMTQRYVRTWNNSVSLWRSALAIDPECADAACEFGQALAVQNDLAGAAKQFQRTLELQPDFTFALNNLGGIYVLAEQYDVAVFCLERVLKNPRGLRDAELSKTQAALGAAYLGLGRLDKAETHTREAIRLGHPRATEMLRVIEERKNGLPGRRGH